MKKSLIAIAIAAAVPTIASAQVTIFGVMDGGYNSVTSKIATTSSVTRNQTGGNGAGALASNRLGFRGTEKIGNLTGGFHYELGMDAGGTGDLATTGGVRKSTVSLSGGFGALEIGRDYTPIFSLSLAADTSMADNVNIGKTVYANVATTRNNGLISYTAPKMGGLTAKFAFSNRSSDPKVSGDVENFGGSLRYDAGPLMLGAAFNQQDSRGATATTKREETLLAATYMVNKALSLQALYGDLKTTGGASDYKGTQVGLRYNLSESMMFHVSGGQGDGAAGDRKTIKLGFINSFSKGIRAYALYGSDDVTKGAAKTERSEFAVGINYSF